MSFERIYSAQSAILSAHQVSIEADMHKGGLPAFNIIGLADKATEESKDRINSAIKHSGFEPPKSSNIKLTISLAPANLKKSGSGFDLAISIAYLIASGQIESQTDKKLFVGELSLDGKVRFAKGILPITRQAIMWGFEEIYIPEENKEEVSCLENIKIYPVSTLRELAEHLCTKDSSNQNILPIIPRDIFSENKFLENSEHKIDHIIGQEHAKRALEIALTGFHNIAFWGPPGSGKSMLAQTAVSLLPDLKLEEMLDVTSIYSSMGILNKKIMYRPPFRSPHHTASYASIIGGGSHIRPGEITLAHKGVLFLDEFPEFDSKIINSLREPLENKKIVISRAKEQLELPADFMLIVAMNPCPCGYLNSNQHKCVCIPSQIQRYQNKISGPIIDRIDMWVYIPKVLASNIINKNTQTSNQHNNLMEKIAINRQVFHMHSQKYLFPYTNISSIKSKDIHRICKLTPEAKSLLQKSDEKLNLSARSIHKIIKLAKTISLIERSDLIGEKHILEALQYRKNI